MLPSPVVQVDCRDQRCPLPVIHLARRITDVATREVIAVAADDPAARIDIPAWCRMRGHEFVGEAVDPDGVPVYLVRRMA
jgi:tRNA 2-thiouridine synthesizing protein A